MSVSIVRPGDRRVANEGGLPASRQHVTFARLACAAHLGASSGLSSAAIAHRVDASNPQSYSRTAHVVVGTTALNFRPTFTDSAMLESFMRALILAYAETLRMFDPVLREQHRGHGHVPSFPWIGTLREMAPGVPDAPGAPR